MIRKSAMTLIIICSLFSMSFAQKNWGARVGFGLTKINEVININRYRTLLGANGALTLMEQSKYDLKIAFDGEASYYVYDYLDYESINISGIRILLDVFPEITLNLSKTVKPGLGIGISGAAEEERHNFDDPESKSEMVYTNGLFGLIIQPNLTFVLENIFLRGVIKYRYLYKEKHYDGKYEGEWNEKFKGNEAFRAQSWDVILSGGLKLGNLWFEGGIQAENWVDKYEPSPRWYKWPEDWEYMLFLRLSGEY